MNHEPLPAQGPVDVNVGRLAARALDVCKQRGWSLRWDARLAQMTCESAEFAEAVRGKRGEPIEEAGDMLFVLMSWTESAGLPFADVVAAAERKCLRLEIVPRYAGEQFETPNALGEGRERGFLRGASSGEAATSTDGLGVAVPPAPTFEQGDKA